MSIFLDYTHKKKLVNVGGIVHEILSEFPEFKQVTLFADFEAEKIVFRNINEDDFHIAFHVNKYFYRSYLNSSRAIEPRLLSFQIEHGIKISDLIEIERQINIKTGSLFQRNEIE